MADPSDRPGHDDDDGHDTSSSPWSFHSAATGQRPRSTRQSSLPRALFGGSGSIFGCGSESNISPRPALSVRPPSNQDTLDSGSQPNVSTLPPTASSSQRYEDEVRATVDRRRLPRAEKDADDPTTPPASSAALDGHNSTTSATLNRLFAVQSVISPDVSRNPSYTQPVRRGYARQVYNGETAALPEHLYTRGLLGGRHSDIVVVAFGKEYKLHRLVLDRAPFFATALSEPWLESNAKQMTVRPEDIDVSITQHAFELALKRLYGCPNVHEEDAHAVGLFATGCWLEMVDLIDSSIESMLRQMTPETLSPLISLVTKNYYGRAGDKILASAKAMLCRDGWRMPLRYWDGVPSDIVREIIGGDGFFIDGEWDRWVLSKRLLDRKLRARAIEAGLLEPGSRRRIAKAPPALGSMAVRFDSVSRRSTPAAFSQGVPDSFTRYVSLYTHPSVEPLLVLLDEGIHYIHLDFEQLQYIRQSRDVLGLPVMPEKVVSSALWQQMELRQRVMNARETDLELGLSVQATEDQSGGDTTMSINNPASPPEGKGKQRASIHSNTEVRDFEEAEDDFDSQSWDGTGRPRKFWIPSSDCNIVMGGNVDPIIATSNSNTLQRHAARLSATLHPEDLTWASDFATSTTTAQPRPTTSDGSMAEIPPPAVSFTHIPPFRFSAEFPAPRLLKERKRVYSRTVFYAGSLWNIYIQKVASARHTKQLGVYLHRAKERETEEAVYGNSVAGGQVEDRIGRLERSMLTSREVRRRRRRALAEEGRLEAEDSSGSADINSVVEAAEAEEAARSDRHLSRRHGKTGQRDVLGSSSTPTASSFPDSLSPSSDHFDTLSDSENDEEDSDSDIDSDPRPHLPRSGSTSRPSIPALPSYVDARPTIRTYFKIYSPSRGGRMLSVYESAPDKFNFSQSWGWKSSTLMLDEGMLEDGEVVQVGVLEGEEGAVAKEAAGARDGKDGKGKADGRLRFMVVIGNI